ncbi:MAG TPA: ABC transporter permease [Vicinamibacterales bacterium]|nr:ABC transporter permease [Vicinamibacterales bacterium]
MHTVQWLESAAQDVRYGFRAMLRSRTTTAVALATLALGIGVNATVFTVTNAVLFKGFAGVHRNDRLLYISNGGCCVAYADFEDYRAQARSFAGMGIVHGISFVYTDTTGFAENVEANENSADVFNVVGQRPLLGRDFSPADEVAGALPVGILHYDFWERHYGKDPAVIGRVVKKNGVPMTIIGVMPEGFSFPQKVDVWVPLVKTAGVLDRGNRATWCVVGRLADGATVEGARTEIDTIAKRLALTYPATNADFRPVVGRFDEFFIGPNARLIYGSMWVAVGFVLLIACANLANLLLARAMHRSREISISVALGARRWRVMQQLLIESVMLSGVGGFLGWWVAKWGVRAYELAMSAKSSWLIIDYTMDQGVLAYLIAVSTGTGLLFGLAPALRLSRLDVNVALKDGGRGATGGGRGTHLSALLVTVEMALAVVLLAGAGVMIRSYLKIHSADMGVNLTSIIGGSVDLPPGRYPRPEQRVAFFDRLIARLHAMPGVESVATADTLPSWGSSQFAYELAGAPSPDEGHRPKLSTLTISPSYFRTLRASVLSGREFNDADVASGARVAIVNQLLAREFWPGEDPVGKRLRVFEGSTPEPWLTVVGVASNIVQNDQTRQRVDPVVYMPYRQTPGGGAWVLVRTSNTSGGVANAFRREVRTLDPDLPLYGPMLIADRMERFWDSRFYGALFLIFAAIALLLASVGLYTVVAHSVGQRTQEIGVRMAVGAEARDILTLVCRQGLLPSGLGLIIGLAASLAVNRVLASALVQVSPSDPLSLGLASAALVGSAMLGCLIPARRAMRVDPIVALRHE